MLPSRKPRIFAVLAFSAATFLPIAMQVAWAQHDTPIIVSDGSLTIESNGVPFPTYTTQGKSRFHPETTKSVPSIEVTIPGHNQTLDISGQRAEVTVQYGKTKILIATGKDGKGLFVKTDFTAFHRGTTDNHLAHNDESLKISKITVKKAGKTVFNATPAGGSKIVIHYQ